jgi:hypothetical protein
MKRSKMGEEIKGEEGSGKSGKGTRKRGSKERKEEQGQEIALNVAGVPIKVDKRYENMSVVEALRTEGVLPINPLEVVDEDTSMILGSQAGTIYGASIYTLAKAFGRDDLPLDKRVRLGLKGARPILAMIFQAVDTYNKFGDIEASLLGGETFEEIKLRLKAGRGRVTPSAQEVIAELQEKLKEVENEKDALKAKLGRKGEKTE